MVGSKTYIVDSNTTIKKQNSTKRRWTQEEVHYLFTYANVLTISQIAKDLKRTRAGVAKKMERLGIIKKDKSVKKISRRKWTNKEINYLTINAGMLTIAQIAKNLKRSIKSIESKLSRLEISGAVQPLPESWTQEEVNYLISHLDNSTRVEIAEALGRTPNSVTKKVNALGLNKSTPRWTEKEIDYLIEFVGRDSVKRMAKTLNKSEYAIQIKLTRLGIGNTKMESPYLTLSDICLAFSISKTTAYKWIEKDGLPARKKVLRLSKKMYTISPSSLWKWVERNQRMIDLRKYEIYSLPDEPKWLKLAIKKQYIETPKRHAVKWTNLEDASLISFWKSGMSQTEMAKRVNRTKKSVENRLKYLRTKSLLERINNMEFAAYLYEEELAIFLTLQKFAINNSNIHAIEESNKILELAIARYELDLAMAREDILEGSTSSSALN